MKIWLSYPSYSYIIQFIGLWYINLAFYLSLDELIKGIISNWCQRLFKELKLREYEKSIGEFKQLHNKIDWKNCEMDWFSILSTKTKFSPFITFLIISHIIQDRGKLFVFFIVLYIFELDMYYFPLIIIDFSFIFLIFSEYLLWIMNHTQYNK